MQLSKFMENDPRGRSLLLFLRKHKPELAAEYGILFKHKKYRYSPAECIASAMKFDEPGDWHNHPTEKYFYYASVRNGAADECKNHFIRVLKNKCLDSAKKCSNSSQWYKMSPNLYWRAYRNKEIWMECEKVFNKRVRPSLDEVYKILSDNKITNQKEHNISYRKLNLPKYLRDTYPSFSWKLRKPSNERKSNERKSKWPSLENIKIIIADNQITTITQYHKNCKRLGLPSQPALIQKNWTDFGLGRGLKLSFNQARDLARKLHARSSDEYKNKRGNLPATPSQMYKSEWTNWSDWLGPSYSPWKK